MSSARVIVEEDEVRVGRDFRLTLQRTLRVPTDGGRYPLPPGLGRLPIRWVDGVGWCVPLHRREALWLAFDAADERPLAVQVGVGRVNAVSGDEWSQRLTGRPQNYLVVPDQLWLDGINAGDGFVRQFLGVPLGEGLTVERLSLKERSRPTGHASAVASRSACTKCRSARSRLGTVRVRWASRASPGCRRRRCAR